MKLEFLECGLLHAPHGIRGALKMETWCDSPAVAAALPALYLRDRAGDYHAHALVAASPYKGGLLVRLAGVESPEQAALLRGQTVYARRLDLDPEGNRVFLAELCGLPLIDAESGQEYGRIREVDTSHKTTLYLVDTPRGEVLFPAVSEFIKEIDLSRGVFVLPIPGLFDEV